MVPFLSSLGLTFHITVFISPLILFTFDGSKDRIKLLDQLQCEVKQNLLNLLNTDYKLLCMHVNNQMITDLGRN